MNVHLLSYTVLSLFQAPVRATAAGSSFSHGFLLFGFSAAVPCPSNTVVGISLIPGIGCPVVMVERHGKVRRAQLYYMRERSRIWCRWFTRVRRRREHATGCLMCRHWWGSIRHSVGSFAEVERLHPVRLRRRSPVCVTVRFVCFKVDCSIELAS